MLDKQTHHYELDGCVLKFTRQYIHTGVVVTDQRKMDTNTGNSIGNHAESRFVQ